jgi:hypothetical protein
MKSIKTKKTDFEHSLDDIKEDDSSDEDDLKTAKELKLNNETKFQSEKQDMIEIIKRKNKEKRDKI